MVHGPGNVHRCMCVRTGTREYPSPLPPPTTAPFSAATRPPCECVKARRNVCEGRRHACFAHSISFLSLPLFHPFRRLHLFSSYSHSRILFSLSLSIIYTFIRNLWVRNVHFRAMSFFKKKKHLTLPPLQFTRPYKKLTLQIRLPNFSSRRLFHLSFPFILSSRFSAGKKNTKISTSIFHFQTAVLAHEPWPPKLW